MTDEAPINESSTPASVMVLASLLGKMVDCGCPVVGQVYEKKTGENKHGQSQADLFCDRLST